MAKHSRRHKRSHSRKHKRSSHRVKRGGSNYSSAASYGSYVNGSGDAQYSRVFDQTVSNASTPSNVIVGAQGQWTQQPNIPTAQNLALVQTAGKSRRKRGGLLGEVITQAVVPFGILGLQQTYKRKRHGGKSRKHRR